MIRFYFAFGILSALFASACATQRPDQERIGSSSIVDKRDYPDVPAVVILDRSELTFSYSTKEKAPYAQVLVTKRAQIFDDQGLEVAKNILEFDERSSVLWVRGRIVKPSGKVIELDDNISVRTPRFEAASILGQLYNEGNGLIKTKLRGAKAGDIVELSYLRVYRDPRWVAPIEIGGAYPVVRGEIVIDFPNAFDVDTRVSKLGLPVNMRPLKLPTRVKGPNASGEGVSGTRLSYVFDNEKAIYKEEEQPDLSALKSQVHVQLRKLKAGTRTTYGYRSWNDVAAWYRNLTKDADKPSAFLEKTLRKYGGKGGSKAQKLKRAQRFVQDRIADAPKGKHLAQYVVQDSEAIVRAGIGDSKDQASLTLATLRTMGLDGFPILVSRSGSFAKVPDLPTPALFDHVIVAVPAGGRYRFIDPATPALAEGRLPGFLQGQRGLLVREDGGELIDLPTDDASDNTRDYKFDLVLSDEGEARGTLRLSLMGLDAAYARALMRSTTLTKSEIAKKMQARFAPSERVTLTWREVLPLKASQKNPNAKLTLQVVLDEAPCSKLQGAQMALDLESILGRPLYQLWREGRRSPWVNAFAYDAKVRLKITLPTGYGVDSLPAPSVFENDYLRAKDSVVIADGKLLFEHSFTLEVQTLTPNEYQNFRPALEALWFSRERALNIVRGGDRGEDYEGNPF